MSGYVKLFSDILESSIWQEDAETRIVWVTLLALADRDGYIRGSPGWLATKAKVCESKCREALEKFEQPDPSSRTPDNDGKRLETLEDGWLVLNYLAFRDRLSSDPQATKTRERVRKHRERYQALRNVSNRYTPLHTVTGDHSASEDVVAVVPKTVQKISGAQLVVFDKELDRTLEDLKRLRSKYNPNSRWTDEDRVDAERLKARRDELRKILGVQR